MIRLELAMLVSAIACMFMLFFGGMWKEGDFYKACQEQGYYRFRDVVIECKLHKSVEELIDESL